MFRIKACQHCSLTASESSLSPWPDSILWPVMDSAEAEQLSEILRTQEAHRGSPICDSLTDFKAALTKTFNPVTSNREKAQELSSLKQGSGSVCDYAISFRSLAVESGWNATALYDMFLKGLAAPI